MDKSTFKKVWHFIWEEDSAASWIVNVLIAFVLIKFLVYPGLGLILNTSHPVVAVVSGSMEHDGSFDDWWSSQALCGNSKCTQDQYYHQFNITKQEFLEYPFKNGFNTGDIMVLYKPSPKNIKVGDILVFQSYRPDPIIHRIIKTTENNDKFFYQTKGDHNLKSISEFTLNEVNIEEDKIVGKAIFRVPLLGYVKIWFVKLINFFRGVL